VIDSVGAHFEALFGPEFGHGKPINRDGIHAALAALEHPERRLAPLIHVAGTNGKGSTIAFLRAILEAAGLRVGAFTKPHLHRLNERFTISKTNAGAIEAALLTLSDRVAGIGVPLTQFEAQAAAAFLLFADASLDVALLETGFGGRDDATNAASHPRICVLTAIDLDHQAILGETRAAIAVHKAGIIKQGAHIVCARQHADALPVIEQAAAAASAPLDLCGRDWDAFLQRGRLIVQDETSVLDLPAPALLGPHQAENAGLAVRAARAFDARLSADALAQGITSARWPGRFAPLTRGPLAAQTHTAGGELWIDAAHNPHAATALARALATLPKRARTVAIVGMLRRKDHTAFIAALAPAIDALIAVPLNNLDAAPAAEIASAAASAGIPTQTAPDIAAAITLALRDGPARLVACGSLRLVAAMLA